jgi:hypothetical protein
VRVSHGHCIAECVTHVGEQTWVALRRRAVGDQCWRWTCGMCLPTTTDAEVTGGCHRTSSNEFALTDSPARPLGLDAVLLPLAVDQTARDRNRSAAAKVLGTDAFASIHEPPAVMRPTLSRRRARGTIRPNPQQFRQTPYFCATSVRQPSAEMKDPSAAPSPSTASR